jgi:hypothetical protein
MRSSWSITLVVVTLVIAACGGGPGSLPTAPSGSGFADPLFVRAPMGLFPGEAGDAVAHFQSSRDGVQVFEPVVEAAWVSSDRSVATVTSSGRVTAVAAGTARLTATYQGMSGSAMVVVLGDGDLVALDVSCPAALLVGQRGPCIAMARLRGGPAMLTQPAWASARSDVVAVDAVGLVTGRAAGQSVVSATYRGRQGTAMITVTAEDALRVAGGLDQGEFRRGTTVTMWLQGYYSVASADSGRLSLRITDQAGTIATTAPLTVARGGDSFLLASTFVIPPSSTEVCRTAILEVGPVTIAEPRTNDSGLRCIAVRP